MHDEPDHRDVASGELADLYARPGHLIRRLQQVSASIFADEAAAAGIDLTPVQYAALSAIRAYPQIDQVTLAGVIAYDRTTIGGVIDRLESKGFVKRILSKGDRRVRRLVLRSEGEKLLDRIKPMIDRVQERILDPLGKAEKVSCMRLLSKLIQAHNEESRAPLRPLSSSNETHRELSKKRTPGLA